jgi:anti-sigma regulatory factor (Ser/Thr protein kinase)
MFMATALNDRDAVTVSPQPVTPAPRRVVAPAAYRAECGGHDAVIRTPARPESVRNLRSGTRAILDSWHLPTEVREDAELVVSELAGNAVRHGRADLTLTLSRRLGALTVTVTDHGPRAATDRVPGARTLDDDPAECGRGLLILAELTDRLTVERRPEGWRVTAALRLPA